MNGDALRTEYNGETPIKPATDEYSYSLLQEQFYREQR